MVQRSALLKKASVLLPLAALSTAWTISLTGLDTGSAEAARALVDGSTAQSPAAGAPATEPPGTEVSIPPELPASLSEPVTVSADKAKRKGAATQGAGQRVSPAAARTASVTGIPSAALAAYQRAGTVINRADPSCNLPWQLVAAVGKVESNHGRYGGNALDADGAAAPGIYGLPLNGTSGTRAISDTDGGQFDRDPRWDRAVGPMQFIPSTWSVVGVDGDGDGVRDPQNVHDAALASAVYLCSGPGDLSTEAGQRAAAFRYNHSTSYVDTVLSVMKAYLDGEFTSVPTNTVPSSDTVLTAREPASEVSENTRGPAGDTGAGDKGDKAKGDKAKGNVTAGGPGAADQREDRLTAAGIQPSKGGNTGEKSGLSNGGSKSGGSIDEKSGPTKGNGKNGGKTGAGVSLGTDPKPAPSEDVPTTPMSPSTKPPAPKPSPTTSSPTKPSPTPTTPSPTPTTPSPTPTTPSPTPTTPSPTPSEPAPCEPREDGLEVLAFPDETVEDDPATEEDERCLAVPTEDASADVTGSAPATTEPTP